MPATEQRTQLDGPMPNGCSNASYLKQMAVLNGIQIMYPQFIEWYTNSYIFSSYYLPAQNQSPSIDTCMPLILSKALKNQQNNSTLSKAFVTSILHKCNLNLISPHIFCFKIFSHTQYPSLNSLLLSIVFQRITSQSLTFNVHAMLIPCNFMNITHAYIYIYIQLHVLKCIVF